jgi:hypothetical protein
VVKLFDLSGGPGGRSAMVEKNSPTIAIEYLSPRNSNVKAYSTHAAMRSRWFVYICHISLLR